MTCETNAKSDNCTRLYYKMMHASCSANFLACLAVCKNARTAFKTKAKTFAKYEIDLRNRFMNAVSVVHLRGN